MEEIPVSQTAEKVQASDELPGACALLIWESQVTFFLFSTSSHTEIIHCALQEYKKVKIE